MRKTTEDKDIAYLSLDIHNVSANECAQLALRSFLDLGSTKAEALTECKALVDKAADLGAAFEESGVPQSVKDVVSNIKPFVEIMDTLSEVCGTVFNSAHQFDLVCRHIRT